MAKMGRPTKFKSDIIKDVMALSQVFCATDEDLAKYWGISTRTLARWKAAHPEFVQAREKGLLNSKISLQTKLYKMAVETGNMTAMIFLLTNKFPDEWKDRRAIVNNTLVNSVSVENERKINDALGNMTKEEVIGYLRQERRNLVRPSEVSGHTEQYQGGDKDPDRPSPLA